jgi:hypothetical protein
MAQTLHSEFGTGSEMSTDMCDECRQIGSTVPSRMIFGSLKNSCTMLIRIRSSLKSMIIAAGNGCLSCKFLLAQFERGLDSSPPWERGYAELPVFLRLRPLYNSRQYFCDAYLDVLDIQANSSSVVPSPWLHICTQLGICPSYF